ncbi:MAG: glycoside hydrolase family 28 protein [Acidobacteria bacterium]|nr:glycoside hydrolase family 28 protein [Acidobacteriota bacterium]
MMNRREFLDRLLGTGLVLSRVRSKQWAQLPAIEASNSSLDPWGELPRIRERIKAPIFAERSFVITDFGALGDNRSDCTQAFERAISACSQAGGGRVLVPQGEFLTGAIRLKSNVNLHVETGATIRFTRDISKYPLVVTRWEGVELINFSPFIYAFEEQNIAITGDGAIDGNADCEHWWPWKGRSRCGRKDPGPTQEQDRNHLFQLAERRVPVEERIFGPGHFLRPQFIQPYRSKNVLIEGVTLLGSPMWNVHPVLSTNVIIRGLTIRSAGPNTDGCDPECSSDVLIEDCFFSTGDDCIAIKSGRNEDGRRLNTATENLIIQNCHMEDGHGGLTIGSEISGGVRNLFAQNCQLSSPHLDSGVRIKNNAMRGGVIENVYVRNFKVGEVAVAGVNIDFFYEEGRAGSFTPIVRHVDIRNLTTHKAKYALYLRGFKDSPIETIRLTDCEFEGVERESVIEEVKNLSFENVRVNGRRLERTS